MDPVGLTFENFDATGRWRDLELGRAVDASGGLQGTDVDGELNGAVSLAKRLAESEQVKACVAINWFRFANGRVATIQYTDAASRASFPWLNLNENHHFYQHDGGFQQQPCADIARFFVEQLAYLCQRLSEVKEGDHTLFDSTAILMCSEIGDPPSHDHKRIPFLLAGNAGGAFSSGRSLKLGNKPHNNLLVSLLNAYGVGDTSFGEAKYCTGPLTGLT